MSFRWNALIFFLFLVIPVSSGQQDTLGTNTDTTTLSPGWTVLPDTRGDLPGLQIIAESRGPASMKVNGDEFIVHIAEGTAWVPVAADHSGSLHFFSSGTEHSLWHVAKRKDGSFRYRHLPLWLSILPPLIAILLALVFKEVIVSLFAGIWAGAFVAGGMRIESLYYFILSLFNVVEKYILQSLLDSGHIAVIVFSLLIGGMVAIISKNGGMAGVVQALSGYARSAKSSQFVTWLLGVAIFFDDYANTLIVGNTMRPVTDRFRISREKLAYIVDSTAAPVAAIAFVTTWIGAELGYIDTGLQSLRGFHFEETPYAVFIQSLKYSFYPVLTLIFLILIIRTGRDYGAMHKAESRARLTGQVSPAKTESEDEPDMEDLGPVPGAPLRWYNAVIPIAAVIFVTIFGLIDTGIAASYGELIEKGITPTTSSWSAVWSKLHEILVADDPGIFMKLGKVIGNADSFVALLWGSVSGVLTAIILTVGGRIIKLFDTMFHLTTGFKTMMPALIILTLAWALALLTDELHTAEYLTALLQGSISPYLMPAIVFVLASSIAFSTGSSWSTMAILYPIAIPTTWAVCHAGGLDSQTGYEILMNVIATVLAASVLGDHCSPISDTTILSSLATDCNHIDHVRTQLPYALTVGVVSLIAGTVATLLGGGWLISFIIGCGSVILLFLILRKFGTPVEVPEKA